MDSYENLPQIPEKIDEAEKRRMMKNFYTDGFNKIDSAFYYQDLVDYRDGVILSKLRKNLGILRFGMPVKYLVTNDVLYFVSDNKRGEHISLSTNDPFISTPNKTLNINYSYLQYFRVLIPELKIFPVKDVRERISNILFEGVDNNERDFGLVKGDSFSNVLEIFDLEVGFDKVFYDGEVYTYGGYAQQCFLLFDDTLNAIGNMKPSALVSVFEFAKLSRVCLEKNASTKNYP